MSDDPDWLREGAPVAVRSGRQNLITIRTVARLTKRDVILDDGVRFNRERLSRSTQSTWDTSWTLHDPADPRIVADYAKQQAQRTRNQAAVKVEKLLLEWRQEGDDRAASEALNVLRDALISLSGVPL